MSGYTLSHRDKWDNPIFRNLLEAAIYAWMEDKAVWKETRIRFNEKLITLKRGQLVTSIRFIAKGFCTSERVTRTFLENLENEGLIDTQPTHKGTIITICNYDEKQLKPKTNDTLSDTQPTHSRHTADTNKNKDNKDNKDIIDDCNTHARKIFVWLEKHFSSPTPYLISPVYAWIKNGADFEMDIKPVAERYKARNQGAPPRSLAWLDEDIARAIQQRNKPLPETPPPKAGNGYVNRDAELHSKTLEIFEQIANEYNENT